MSLTIRRFRALHFDQRFHYDGDTVSITVFEARGLKNVGLIHETQPGKKARIFYVVHGHRTDSVSDAVRIFNREEKARATGRRVAPGSPEQIAARRSGGD